VRLIVLSCPQYRLGGQDVATDQALRATDSTQLHDASGIAARRIGGLGLRAVARRASSRCGRGSNTASHLTVFNRPSSVSTFVEVSAGGYP
jgi:hypothetical protein